MSFQPGPALGLAVLAFLYGRAVRVLGKRGYHVPAGQQAWWWLGFLLLAGAFFSPLDEQAEDGLAPHMAQHVLMADVAVPLMLIGIRSPVLQFLLPRALMEPLARRRGLRAFGARLRNPAMAVGIYAAVLYAWHIGPLFEAALENQVVHGLQHQSFIAASVLVWWPLIEPGRRRMPGELWKIGYIIGARLPAMFLGMAFVVSKDPIYAAFYGTGERAWGLDALGDQQIGGGLMAMVDIVTLLLVLTVVFWRAASDNDAKAPGDEHEAERDLTQVEQDGGDVDVGRDVAGVRK
jgi:cytochrome c oxidase assembly factor CtaG